MSAHDGRRGGRNTVPEKRAEKKKTPIILAHKGQGSVSPRPDSREGSSTGRLWTPDSVPQNVKQTSTSQKHNIPLILQSGELPMTQPAYRIQQRNNVIANDGSEMGRRSQMSAAVKLVDEYLNWQGSSLQQYVTDDEQFRVIGVMGTCSVGKSYILNLLAGDSETVFGTSGKERSEHGYRTNGIDVYITSCRTILIDVQPMQCSNIVNDIMHWSSERKHINVDKYKEYKECEAIAEHMDVELTMFLLAVCHIVMVIEDSPPNPSLHRLLQMSEMLRPSLTSNDKSVEDSPPFPANIVFVQNKCQRLDSLTETFDMESFIYLLYKQPMSIDEIKSNPQAETAKPHIPLSKLKIASRGKSRATVLKLPFHGSDHDSNKLEIIERNERSFVEDVLSMKVESLRDGTSLSEKDWLVYAAKVWDAGVTSSLLQEFMRISLSLFDS